MLKKGFAVGDPAAIGLRLDVFLHRQIPDFTRAQFQRFIDKGQVKVNGEPRKPSYKIRRGDWIEAEVELPEALEVGPEEIPLDVLHEDDHVIVLNKPSGLIVHPGIGARRGTLVNALLFRYPEIARLGPEDRPGIVHRLDRDTSGVMLVARSPLAYEELKRQFRSREIKKIYTALVVGHMPQPEGTLDQPIGRHVKYGNRISVLTDRPRVAITEYRVAREIGGYSLLEIHLLTGRTHQIRVHMSAAGHPVAGDRRYGARGPDKKLFPRLFLHARKIGFRHPETCAWLEFEAPLAPELQSVLDRLAVPDDAD